MRTTPEEDPEFQIAPMIDILLVLLVFFMSISSTEVLQNNDNVKLPVAKDAKDVKAEDKNPTGQIKINVLWNAINNAGSIEINSNSFATPADIVPILQGHMAAKPDARILVRADKQVRYEYMKQLLKAVGQSGGSNVTFSVVDKDPGATAPATASNP